MLIKELKLLNKRKCVTKSNGNTMTRTGGAFRNKQSKHVLTVENFQERWIFIMTVFFFLSFFKWKTRNEIICFYKKAVISLALTATQWLNPAMTRTPLGQSTAVKALSRLMSPENVLLWRKQIKNQSETFN